jgi:hypothetical protein
MLLYGRAEENQAVSANAEIIKKPYKGEKLINLVKTCFVGRATIYDIRKNREKIECFVKNTYSGATDRHTLNIE